MLIPDDYSNASYYLLTALLVICSDLWERLLILYPSHRVKALIVLRFIQSYDSGSQRKSLRKHVSLPGPKLWAFASLSPAKIIPGPAMSGLHMLLRAGLEPKVTEVTAKGLCISLLVNNAKLQK